MSPARLLLALSLASLAAGQVPFTQVLVDPSGPKDMHTKAAGDLDGDGFQDLVVAGKGGALHWYEDRSAPGAWTRHVITGGGLGNWSTDAECGDLDGDGDVDLVISDWYSNQRLVWFENLGGGAAFDLQVIGAPRAHDIELADLDGDGDLDVATRQQGANGGVIELWRNQGAGAAWAHATLPLSAAMTGEGLAAGDVDLDGDPDLVLGRVWYENLGNFLDLGAWDEHVYAPGWGGDATGAALADVDGDGLPDIVLTPNEAQGGSGRTAWFEAPLDPRSVPWAEHVIEAGIETVTHTLALGDLDLDGDVDVLTAEMHQGADPDEVRVYLNEGAGLAWTKQVVATGGSHSMRLVDVGADGDLDLFGANWTGTTVVDLWENELALPNDGCAGALTVGEGTYAGTLVGATGDGSASCGTSNGSADVWFRFVSPCAGSLEVTTCGSNDLPGLDLGTDTVLSLHAGCPGAASNQLGCNDNDPTGSCGGLDQGALLDSALTLPVATGQVVLIRVSCSGASAPGEFLLNVDHTPEPCGPSLSTGAVSLDCQNGPGSVDVILSNASECTSMGWVASSTCGYVSLSPSSGTLPPGGSLPVTVALDCAAAPCGTSPCTVTFDAPGCSPTAATLDVTALGHPVFTYCNPGDGSANNTATIGVSTCELLPGATVELANGPPAQYCYLLIGNGNGLVSQPPGAQGDLCLTGGSRLARYANDVGQISASGTFATDISNSVTGGPSFGVPGGGNLQSGETWYFQYWHRRPLGQPSTFSEALGVTFR